MGTIAEGILNRAINENTNNPVDIANKYIKDHNLDPWGVQYLILFPISIYFTILKVKYLYKNEIIIFI